MINQSQDIIVARNFATDLFLTSRVEAGYNTSPATMRDVGGDEKGTCVSGGKTGPPCQGGGLNTETWSYSLSVGRNADDLVL
jgi:hypothetical protein